MDVRRSSTASVPVPTSVETVAIEETIRYFRRAGTRAATLLLITPDGGGDRAMLELLRDELLACASFCESVLERADERRRQR